MENIITKRLISLVEDNPELSDEQKRSAKNLIWLTDISLQSNLYVLFLKDQSLMKKFVDFGVREKTAINEKDEKKLEDIFMDELAELRKIEEE
jgi:hypothetical protein